MSNSAFPFPLSAIPNTSSANMVLAGPTTGSPAAPNFRALVSADIASVAASAIDSGTIATARLGSGSASATTFLAGDQTYKSVASASGAFQVIQQIITAGSQATVDFTSIPATYSALKVLWFGQDTQAGTAAVVTRVIVNNDTTAGNYTSTQRMGAQNGVGFVNAFAASSNGVMIGAQPQAGNTGVCSAGEATFVGYAGTSFHKRILSFAGSDDATANGFLFTGVSRWKSTSAINRLTFTTDGTAFANGSIFTLYGLV